MQIEGKSSLKVWSKNDDLVIDETMKPNDVVFIPKGTNHHIIGLTKRLSEYSSKNGKGIIQFKKDYQNYILNKYVVKEKEVAQ